MRGTGRRDEPRGARCTRESRPEGSEPAGTAARQERAEANARALSYAEVLPSSASRGPKARWRRPPCHAMDRLVPPKTPIACNLTAIPDVARPRYFAVRSQVLTTVESVVEIDDGFVPHVGAD